MSLLNNTIQKLIISLILLGLGFFFISKETNITVAFGVFLLIWANNIK
jgi:hypothetical protein